MRKTLTTKSLRFQKFGTVVVLFLLVFISACKKDSLIRTGVQPVGDNLSLQQTDTFTIYAETYKIDSVRSDGVVSGVFGYNEDGVFGTSSASFITQFKPSGLAAVFSTINEVVIDSVVLSIQPEACYGDVSKSTSFSLYALEDAIDLDSNYYTSQSFNYNSTPLSTVNLSEIAYIDSLERYQTIDFVLDSIYGVELLQAINASTDKDLFFKTYKGFVFEANSTMFDDNMMIHADLYSSFTKLVVYYKQNSTATLAEEYEFIIDNTCERINAFENDYSLGSIDGSFDDALAGKELVYLQDMSGLGVNISIPNLQKLYQGSAVVVNKAELILPVSPSVESNLPFHSEITLGAYTADGVLLNTIDAVKESHFNGLIQDDRFVFNITRDVQLVYSEYITGNDVNFGYSLLSLSPEQNTNGTALLGTNPTNSTDKMKFVLTYSLAK